MHQPNQQLLRFSLVVKQANSQFQPRQIVYLEHGSCRLYCEVIQVISSRQRCWVRPWFLAIASPEEPETIYNLHESANLVWHASEFCLALDAELIPLLTRLNTCDRDIHQTRQQLNYFLNQLWRETSVPKKLSC